MIKNIAKHLPKRAVTLLVMLAGLAIIGTGSVSGTGSPTSTRPISDFVSTQGTFCIDDGMGGCFLFVPPIANFVGISDPNKNISMSMDYAGLANSSIVANGGASLGTATSGTIIERPLPDGRAEVQVLLHTTNALTWVIDGGDFGNGPLLFGNRAPDVLGGADAALGDSFLQVVFNNTAPGSPLPDLIQLLAAPEAGQDIISIAFRGRADGMLHAAFGVPEGTPGRADTTQSGILFRGPFKGATADGFPAEHIDLHVVGR